MLNKISNKFKTYFVMFYDFCIAAISFLLAYFLRIDGFGLEEALYWEVHINILIIAPVQLLCIYLMGNYRGIWRFSSIVDLVKVIKGVSLAIPVSMLVLFIFKQIDVVPRSVLIIQWFLLLVGVGGGRFAYRLYKDSIQAYVGDSRNRTEATLVVGAGFAGQALVKDILNDAESNTRIVGFVDDNIVIKNKVLLGFRILGNIKDIPRVAEGTGATTLIIAMPSASREVVARIVKACESTNLKVRSVPKYGDIISGKLHVSKLKKVMPEDLLGREKVELDLKAMNDSITNKVIVVTGGGGSIGSELCLQILKFAPLKLICFDISEYNLYEFQSKLSKLTYNSEVKFVVGDVRDELKINELFSKYKPDAVYHAAAYKHVPMMELNPSEAIKVNISGTKIMANMCHKYKVKKFILISTDKAVNPTNVMGTTKRIAEMICQNIQKKSKTKFIVVRFGNVLGSSGSVIPRFQSQIEKGGPITVTHPEIERYFMSIPEAAQLVMQAGSFGDGGEIFVLDMGNPVKIVDLAHHMITLAGLKVGKDIDIEFTGLRPGEKLFEELLANDETTLPTQDYRVRVAKVRDIDEMFESQISSLLSIQAESELRDVLKSIVPEYDIPKNILMFKGNSE